MNHLSAVTGPPRVVAYIRMSRDKQEDSPERQRAQIESYARSCGYTIRDTYLDPGIAGDDSERPDFRRMLADAQLGMFDVILIDEPSRLSRSKPLQFLAEVVYPLERAKITVEAVSSGPLSWTDIGGLIMTAIHADRSSAEVKNMSRRVLDGMARSARAAFWNGEAPLGYVVREIRDTENPRKVLSRRLVPGDRRYVNAVRWVFREYARGCRGLAAIAAKLASRGIVSKKRRGANAGKAITPQGIACILRNPAYVGDTTWNRRSVGKYCRLVDGKAQFQTKRGNNPESEWIVVRNSHPSLVSRKTFQAIKERLKTHPKRTVR
jgi:site-specific DNA recombinase